MKKWLLTALMIPGLVLAQANDERHMVVDDDLVRQLLNLSPDEVIQADFYQWVIDTLRPPPPPKPDPEDGCVLDRPCCPDC